MLPRIKELKKFEKISRNKKLPESPSMDCTGCKQVIALPGGSSYCGVWKEKISETLCKCCPYYDREALEYRLFRRE